MSPRLIPRRRRDQSRAAAVRTSGGGDTVRGVRARIDSVEAVVASRIGNRHDLVITPDFDIRNRAIAGIELSVVIHVDIDQTGDDPMSRHAGHTVAVAADLARPDDFPAQLDLQHLRTDIAQVRDFQDLMLRKRDTKADLPGGVLSSPTAGWNALNCGPLLKTVAGRRFAIPR